MLDLWVADKGTLSGGAGPWPLLDEGNGPDGRVDVFEGVPFGLSQRGLVINAPLIGATWLIGGRPGQGKSSALRTLMLGAALDPTAELWAFVLGESPDFDPFAPRLSRYRMGMDDAVAEAACARAGRPRRRDGAARESPRRAARSAAEGVPPAGRQPRRSDCTRWCARSMSATSCSNTPATASAPPNWPCG